jgi:ABC-2 type transport system permease protein
LRLELSGQIRDGKLAGFLEIGPSVLEPAPQGTSEERHALRYTSNRPTFRDFTLLAVTVIGESVKRLRAEQAFRGKWEAVEAVMRPVPFQEAGLASRDPDTGEIREGTEETRLAPVLVPVVLTILMFMVVLMGATPLMQGVVEEKMQRIAEVLLGCVGPFQLMLGKLLGNAATSLTITSVYLGGAFWLAHHYNVADQVPLGLLVWFLIFQVLAALMYGSLFIAIGAACSDMKETQSLLWPVMLLACLPMFMLRTVIQEPHGPASSSLSFFPFSTPMLMVARLAVPPPMPLWQPLLGMALVLLTTLTCVWVAGRIFRVGILMQGKGARLADLWRWVIRG